MPRALGTELPPDKSLERTRDIQGVEPRPPQARRSFQALKYMDTSADSFAAQGFALLPHVLDASACDEAAAMLEKVSTHGAGSRRLLERPWCQHLARQIRSHSAVSELLSPDAVAVQCTVFDKSPAKNWLVAFHQDRSIPVLGRVNAAGLSVWSEKEGELFVQPPASVLEQMIAVRLHIDPCPAESGALRVVPGSHLSGVLDVDEVERFRNIKGEKVLPAPRGGALLLKPLLLHASSKVSASLQRRVLHFVYGPRELPLGLKLRHAI